MFSKFYNFFRFLTYIEGKDREMSVAMRFNLIEMVTHHMAEGNLTVHVTQLGDSKRFIRNEEYVITLEMGETTGLASLWTPYICVTLPKLTRDQMQRYALKPTQEELVRLISPNSNSWIHIAVRDSFFSCEKYAFEQIASGTAYYATRNTSSAKLFHGGYENSEKALEMFHAGFKEALEALS